MDTIWVACLEVLAYIDSAPIEGELGFINVVVSANDAASAEAKVRAVLKEYGWEVLGIEGIYTVSPDRDYDDDLPELIEDVIAHPEHIRLSTLYSYKPN